MTYIDGFLIPVPADKKEAYRELAALAAPVFLDHGALEVIECWGDDVPRGEVTDFFRAVKAEEGEQVVFSWIVWPSREARDLGSKNAMEDPRLKMPGDMPFDPKRMMFGGFSPILRQSR